MNDSDVSIVSSRRRFGFVRRHKHALLGFSGVFLVLIIGSVVVQCVYAAQGHALPFTRVGGMSVTGMNETEVAKLLQTTYGSPQLTLKVRDTTVKTTLAKAGIAPDYENVLQRTFDDATALRFVPFSLFRGAVRDVTVGTVIDDEHFTEFSKEVVPLCTQAPRDADVTVKDGVLQLSEAANGTICTTKTLHAQLASTPMTRQGVVRTVTLTTVKPTVSTDSAKQLLAQAQALTKRQLTLQLLTKTYTPDSSTIASWLSFAADPLTKKPTVGFSSDALTAYLTTLQKDIYIAPTTTVIQVNDGVEASRVLGANGRGLAMEHDVALLQKQLQAGDGVVVLTTAVLPPPITYNRNYSKTQAGLQALLNDLVKTKGDYAISLRQLGGSGWSASANGSKVYKPASTYKLFVAYALLRQIESGERHWEDTATNGRTISQCFDVMIINSDNACAEWFGNAIGWKTITDMIHGAGLSNATSLNTPKGFVATADDEALFLTKLQTGQLLNPDSTSRLLGVMQRQVYRSGIPAGAGATVADKVGFLNGLLHDAAIVYAPSGTYVLVIMSSGSSWGQIADATRQIAALLQ